MQSQASSAAEMPPPFRLLIVEDEATDAELELEALSTAGFDFVARRVATRTAFIDTFRDFRPDIVIADYQVPGFGGFEAARLAKTERADCPVILVTGVLRDDAAMEVRKAGINGYILKDRLVRLPAAVVAALQEAEGARARRRAETTRDELAHILESAKDAVIGSTIDGTISAWNRSAAAIFGSAACEAIGHPLRVVLGSGYTDTLGRVLRQVEQGGDAADIETSYRKSDGATLDLSLAVSAVLDVSGAVKGTSIIVRDITEQRHLQRQIESARHKAALLEERIRAAEELHRWIEIIENITVGVSVVDVSSGTIAFANEAYAAMHGTSLEKIVGGSLFDLYPAAERERVAELCSVSDHIGCANFQADRRREDGSIFPARIHFTSVRQASGEVHQRIVTVADISTERALEVELRQAQRLEAIGQLTAGVAHDFNNLLQGIMAHLELLEDEVQDRRPALGLVGDVLRIAQHGADLTRHLLSFARRQVLRPRAIDLDAFFTGLARALSRSLDPRIRVTMVAEPGLPPIVADTAHLHTALLNLAINARDAMPSGGNLCIEAMRCAVPDADEPMATEPNHMAVIRVQDTGTGMLPEILAKVCDPFFSTKGLNGTGLGLSMVYGFAKQSGGDLRITSEPGNGTCVELYLPLAPAGQCSSLSETIAAVPSTPCTA